MAFLSQMEPPDLILLVVSGETPVAGWCSDMCDRYHHFNNKVGARAFHQRFACLFIAVLLSTLLHKFHLFVA